jgi:DNA-binding transcriptional ArsR family regulator
MMDTTELAGKADDAAALLSAMSNSKRLMILCNLVPGEMPVGALAEEVGLSQSALSQHLAKLRARQLVKTRRDAQTIYYSVASEDVLEVLRTLYGIFCANHDHQPTRSAA